MQKNIQKIGEQKEQLERLEPKVVELQDSVDQLKKDLKGCEQQIQDLLLRIAVSRELL